MPLAKEKIFYNLGIGGVDQKTHQKFAQLGRPVELANARFPKTGVIAKRYGLVPAVQTQSYTIQRLLALGDELLMVGKTSTGIRGWFSRVADPNNTIQSAGIHRVGDILLGGGNPSNSIPAVPRAWVDNLTPGPLPTDLYACDMAIGMTQTCYVYRRSSGNGSRVCIVESATGHVLYEDVHSSGGGQTQIVRVVNVPGSNAFIVGSGGSSDTTLVVALYAASATTGLVSALATNSSITLNANGTWDWALFGSKLIIAYRTAAATTLTVTRFDVTSTALGSPTTGSAITMTTGPDKVAVAVPYASTEDAVILAHETTNGLRGLTVSTSTLAVVQALWVVNANLSVRNQIAGCRLASGDLYTLSEINNASTYLISVFSSSGAINTTPATVVANGSCYLGSKPIVTSASVTPFWLAMHRDTTADLSGAAHARFLMEGGTVVGRFLRGDVRLPPTANSSPFLPQIASMPADNDLQGAPVAEYAIAALRTTDTTAGLQNNAFGSPALFLGSVVAAHRFNVHPNKGYVALEDDRTLLITGGFLSCYDGQAVMENGFLLPPEIISITPSNSSGSMPSSGSFSVIACYARTDAKGRVHRSAPSAPVACTTGVADDTLAVVVRALQFSQATNYRIEIYRTENAGSIYYLDTTYLTAQVATGTTTVSVTAGQSDTTLITSTPLGQQSAIIENDQPSCPITIASDGRRVHCVSGADRFAVIEGKERVAGEGASFFPDITRRVTRDGELIALENVGERWVALKKRRFFIASGEGSDDTGQTDSLSEFEAHPTLGVGVSHARELVQTPFGLIFHSAKGYYMIDSGGGVTPIGVGIDDYKDFPVVSAVFHADRNEVHFLLLDGPRLVLSIHETEGPPNFRWSIDDEDDRADAYCDIAVVGGLLYAAPAERLSTDNYEIFVEDIGGYADQGSAYPVVMRFRTGWIPVAGGLQGRGRLYAALFLGDIPAGGPHVARVRARYDYRDDWIDDKSISSANATASSELPYQWRFKPTRQKIQAVQFEVSETLTEPLRGAEFSQLMLVVGAQPGAKNVRRSQRAVTT